MRQLIVFEEHFDWLLKLQIFFAIHLQSVSVDIYPAALQPSKYSPSDLLLSALRFFRC